MKEHLAPGEGVKIELIDVPVLSAEDAALITEFNLKEFKQPPMGTDGSYCLIKKDGELKAFGKITNFDYIIVDVPYRLLMVSSVVAIEKKKGYGGVLMRYCKGVAHLLDKSMIGVCTKDKSDFYKKSGFGILRTGEVVLPGEDKRDGRKFSIPNEETDIFYIEGSDGFIQALRRVAAHRENS